MSSTTKAFAPYATTDEILQGVNLKGKRALVTGVSAGLGVEISRVLVGHGATVVGTARDLAKADKATAVVRDSIGQSGGSFEIIHLDVADLSSVRSTADKLLQRGETFDYVFANAGIMAHPYARTVDGLEIQLGTNVLGHFVLVNKLVPLLKSGSRVIFHTSSAHRISDFDFKDPNFESTEYETWTAYGQSKTANILNTVAFDNRHKAQGIRAIAIHPGVIFTELSRHVDPKDLQNTIAGWQADRHALGLEDYVFKEPNQGASTAVWAGVVADINEVGGKHCEDNLVSPILKNETHIDLLSQGVREYAIDPKRAEDFWAKAEELVKEKF